jgi:hypothetical protein
VVQNFEGVRVDFRVDFVLTRVTRKLSTEMDIYRNLPRSISGVPRDSGRPHIRHTLGIVLARSVGAAPFRTQVIAVGRQKSGEQAIDRLPHNLAVLTIAAATVALVATAPAQPGLKERKPTRDRGRRAMNSSSSRTVWTGCTANWSDLYYCLNLVTVALRSLRERRQDIPVLAQ